MSLLNVINEAEQKYNLEQAKSRLERASSLHAVGKIAQSVHAACNEKKGGNFHYMTKDGKTEFWDLYSTKRNLLRAEPAAAAKSELDEAIPSFKTRAELYQVRSQILKIISLSKEEKEHYRKKCDQRIYEIAA